MGDDHPALERAAVESVLHRFVAAVDRRDWPTVRACFAAEACTVYRGEELSIADALPLMERDLATTAASTHMVSTFLCTVSHSTAQSTAYALVRARQAGGSTDVVLGVRYENTYVQGSGRWAIERNEVTTIFSRTEPVAGPA